MVNRGLSQRAGSGWGLVTLHGPVALRRQVSSIGGMVNPGRTITTSDHCPSIPKVLVIAKVHEFAGLPKPVGYSDRAT